MQTKFNMYVRAGISEGEERENREEIFQVIMAKNIPNLITENTKSQILEAQRIPGRNLT